MILIVFTVVLISFCIKPKYQEVKVSEDFSNYHLLIKDTPISVMPQECMLNNNSFITSCCGLLKARITDIFYYLVSYIENEDDHIDVNNREIKWYKFNSENIPYELNGYVVGSVIRVFEVQYTEDITTGYCFDSRREYYAACKFEKENPDNKKYIRILGDYKALSKFRNKEYLERWHNNKIYNEKDLKKWEDSNYDMNKIIHMWSFELTYQYANNYYYNLVTINNKEYMQLHLYKIENGEKVKIDFLDRWGILGEELQKIKEQEIYSEDKNYIFGLYPLDEVKEIILKLN